MISESNQVTIIKMNAEREETWRYNGRIISRSPHSLLVEAFFNINDVTFHGITIRRNDRSIERFFDDRWYNIFEIHDRENDNLKAWYCNVTKPAEFTPGQIAYVDLALDVLAYPNGDYLVLDEDEFHELSLEPVIRAHANNALTQLVKLAQSGELFKPLK